MVSMPDYDICIRSRDRNIKKNRQVLEANEMKVLKKVAKQNKNRENKKPINLKILQYPT